MIEEVAIGGVGGQGILLIGQLLAQAGVLDNKEVCYVPSYGTETRGGHVSCMVSISSQQVDSPILETFDTLLAFEEQSLRRFEEKMKEQGLIIWNSSLIKKGPSNQCIKTIEVNLSITSKVFGNPQMDNMIMLGVYSSTKQIVSRESMREAIRNYFLRRSSEFGALNLRAFQLGCELVTNTH
jgi:2-oxoglutarate ferredoxin oxidoreductase subunit gamma